MHASVAGSQSHQDKCSGKHHQRAIRPQARCEFGHEQASSAVRERFIAPSILEPHLQSQPAAKAQMQRQTSGDEIARSLCDCDRDPVRHGEAHDGVDDAAARADRARLHNCRSSALSAGDRVRLAAVSGMQPPRCPVDDQVDRDPRNDDEVPVIRILVASMKRLPSTSGVKKRTVSTIVSTRSVSRW